RSTLFPYTTLFRSLLCRRLCGSAAFGSLDEIFLSISYFHNGETLYLVDGHFVQDVDGIFVSGFLIGFYHHYKILISAFLLGISSLCLCLFFAGRVSAIIGDHFLFLADDLITNTLESGLFKVGTVGVELAFIIIYLVVLTKHNSQGAALLHLCFLILFLRILRHVEVHRSGLIHGCRKDKESDQQ